MSILTKTEVRKSMNKVLRAISQNTRLEESKAVLEKLQCIPQYANAHTVAVFLSMKTEVETRPIMDDCSANGRSILVPKILSDSEFEFVRVDSSSSVDQMPLDKWGIPIPPFEDARRMVLHPEYAPDVIIVPGVAFDAKCHRLGHGKGYYGEIWKEE